MSIEVHVYFACLSQHSILKISQILSFSRQRQLEISFIILRSFTHVISISGVATLVLQASIDCGSRNGENFCSN